MTLLAKVCFSNFFALRGFFNFLAFFVSSPSWLCYFFSFLYFFALLSFVAFLAFLLGRLLGFLPTAYVSPLLYLSFLLSSDLQTVSVRSISSIRSKVVQEHHVLDTAAPKKVAEFHIIPGGG